MRYAVFAALLLAGCASSGTKIDPTQVEAFHHGETTYTQVVARIGQPTMVSNLPDGTRIAVYSYAHVSIAPQTFVPVVGLMAGHSDVQSQSYSFIFTKDGVLK